MCVAVSLWTAHKGPKSTQPDGETTGSGVTWEQVRMSDAISLAAKSCKRN